MIMDLDVRVSALAQSLGADYYGVADLLPGEGFYQGAGRGDGSPSTPRDCDWHGFAGQHRQPPAG